MKTILILLLSAFLAGAKEFEETEPKNLREAYAWVVGAAAAPLLLPLLLLGRDTRSETYETIHELGFIVIPIGWSVAPSMGRLYAGDYKAGWGGIGLRLGAISAFGAVVLPCMYTRCSEALVAIPLAATGVWIGSGIYDVFWGTPHSVRRHNAKIGLVPYIPRMGSAGVMAHFEF